MNETIKEIKKELRANMNGIASAAMRQTEDYRLNWGIELPRVQMIAREFEPSHELAQALWKESVRECKILACLLMPIEGFDEEMCDVWAESIRTSEIAQIFCLHLVRRLRYASSKAFEWMASDQKMKEQLGCLTMCHVLRMGELSERSADEFLDQASALLPATYAVKALQIFASLSDENAKRVKKIADYLF